MRLNFVYQTGSSLKRCRLFRRLYDIDIGDDKEIKK